MIEKELQTSRFEGVYSRIQLKKTTERMLHGFFIHTAFDFSA